MFAALFLPCAQPEQILRNLFDGQIIGGANFADLVVRKYRTPGACARHCASDRANRVGIVANICGDQRRLPWIALSQPDNAECRRNRFMRSNRSPCLSGKFVRRRPAIGQVQCRRDSCSHVLCALRISPMLPGFSRLKSRVDGTFEIEAINPAADHRRHGRRRCDGLAGVVCQTTSSLDHVDQVRQGLAGCRDFRRARCASQLRSWSRIARFRRQTFLTARHPARPLTKAREDPEVLVP